MTTRATRLTTAAVAAGVLAAAGTWFAVSAGDEKPGTRPFWSMFNSVHSMEIDPPDNVDEATQRADAVVVGHVTGVLEGRENKGWFDPTPQDLSGPKRRNLANLQITVDRVVKGKVSEGQVLNFETFQPPQPLTLDQARAHLPEGKVLLFLYNRAELGKRSGYGALVKPADSNIWVKISDRGMVAETAEGLATPFDFEVPASYVASFQATTVGAAADRAAGALR